MSQNLFEVLRGRSVISIVTLTSNHRWVTLDFSAECANLRERGFPFSPLATCFARVFFDNLRITASPVGSECATSDGRARLKCGRDRLKRGRGWLKRDRVGLERGRARLKRRDFPGNHGLG